MGTEQGSVEDSWPNLAWESLPLKPVRKKWGFFKAIR